ncbi:phage/plasmid primase, P4 family [Methanothrix sp.]|uniref:phage/plasmid primase, P4 family n=1 Tax=Methanothrix sp. TaxID=90426 RepID=UPI00329A17AA
MASTATDLTREHYARPEIREIITKFTMPGDGNWRAINGDFWRWYRYAGSDARLLNVVEDYDELTNNHRVLYSTLNVFDKNQWMVTRPKEEITRDDPLGTPADTVAYSLGVDIDKGPGHDIEEPEVKLAVESAAQFLVDRLQDAGVHRSVWVLFSGGGIYVEIHHGICRPKSQAPQDRQEFFEELTDRYNRFIVHVSTKFFEIHPEYKGLVKYDALNDSKRIFKCVLSIHKKKPYAVTPLNRDHIKIDFDRARVPLPLEMIEEAGVWYSTYDLSERENLLELLDQFKETDEKKRAKHHFAEIWRSCFKVDAKYFPPCIQHIIDVANQGEGKTRFSAVLSAFLFQMGWEEEEAWDLVKTVSDRNGLGDASHIFDSCFGRISCPSCETIQADGAGYPHLGLRGLECCVPDEHCKGCQWPGDYHLQKALDENFDKPKMEEQKPKPARAPLRCEDVCDVKYDKNGDPQGLKLSPTKAATAVCEKLCIAMVEGSKDIYRWDGQIYRPDGARIIDDAINHLVGDENDIRKLNEILRRVSNHLLAKPTKFEPDPYLFGVKNGVVDLRTGEFRDYRAEDLLLEQADVIYDPNAKCPTFLAFLESITPDPTDRLMLIDWFAITAIKEPFAYVLFLLGLGRNGKGVYEDLIMRFFGEATFRDMPLRAIEKSDFASSEFYQKRGWIASETGKHKSSIGTDFIKLTSGSGVIDANVKGKSRIRFRPYFQTIVDTNTMPQIDDNSIGWRERFCKANMPYFFVPAPDPENSLEKLKDPHLIDKLTTPGELSGILNLIVLRTKEIAKTKTIIKRSGEEMFNEYATQSASVGTFLEMFCEYVTDGPDFWTPVAPIYTAYKEWCTLKVGDVVNPGYFGKLLTGFCGGTNSKVGKDKDRMSIRLYKRLNFDQNRYEKEAKRLRRSLSTDVYNKSTVSLQCSSSTDSDVYSVYSKIWNDVYERFGDTLYMAGGFKKTVDTVDTVDIDSSGGPSVSTTGNFIVDTTVDSIDAELPRAQKHAEDKERHFAQVADEHTKPKVCAVCGEDLTGHGTVERNGKIYCARPGCGYPPRDETVVEEFMRDGGKASLGRFLAEFPEAREGDEA